MTATQPNESAGRRRSSHTHLTALVDGFRASADLDGSASGRFAGMANESTALHYGPETFPLGTDEDRQQLAERIADAVRARGGWVDVTTATGEVSLLITPRHPDLVRPARI